MTTEQAPHAPDKRSQLHRKRRIHRGILCIFLTVSLPLIGADAVIQICHIPDAPWQTRSLIINPGPDSITVEYHHRRSNGVETVSPPFTVVPGGSYTLDGETMGTGGTGWLDCTGDTTPIVVLSYRYAYTESVCRFILTPDRNGTKWLLPLPKDGPQDWYGIAIAAPRDKDIRLELAGIRDNRVTEQTALFIQANGKMVNTLASIFSHMNDQRPDWLLITTSSPIVPPIGIAGNNSQNRHLFFSGQAVPNAGEEQARRTIPHVAGSDWHTSLEVINPDPSTERNVTLYRPQHSPRAQPAGDIGLLPMERTVLDLGQTGEPGPLVINSRQPLITRLQYQYRDSPSICSFFLNDHWSRKWILPCAAEDWLDWHGFAIGNPLSLPVTVTTTAVGPEGPLASTTRILPANDKWVGLVKTWFADAGENAPDLSQTVYFLVESDIQLPAPLLISGNTTQDRHVFLPGIAAQEADAFTQNGPALGSYWPTGGWRECLPEEVGMDSTALRKARDYAVNPSINTHAILVIRDGYIVAEQYFQGNTKDTIRHSFSIAKSFTSCLTGIALDRGEISGIDIPIYTFFPQWQEAGTPAIKQRITLRQLLTMTSGIEWNQDAPDYDLTKMTLSGDYIGYVLNKSVTHEPGTYWQYNNGACALFSGIIQQATGLTAEQYANSVLFPEIGFKYDHWDADQTGHSTTAWGIYTTVRQFAKFGYLYLNKGNWNGTQVISEDFVAESGQPVSNAVNWYGYLWWLKPSLENWENSIVPDNLMIAWGKYSQQIFVLPDQRLLVLRFGNDPYSTSDDWDEIQFLTEILHAITK